SRRTSTAVLHCVAVMWSSDPGFATCSDDADTVLALVASRRPRAARLSALCSKKSALHWSLRPYLAPKPPSSPQFRLPSKPTPVKERGTGDTVRKPTVMVAGFQAVSEAVP